MLKILLQKLLLFRDEREWKKFHTPLNLAISLQLESSEILEHFQWMSEEEIIKALQNKTKKSALKEELADVFAYLLLLSESLQIDLGEALLEKIDKNAIKYPIEKARGNAKKYTELAKE